MAKSKLLWLLLEEVALHRLTVAIRLVWHGVYELICG